MHVKEMYQRPEIKKIKNSFNSSLCIEDASSTALNKMSEICFILYTKIFTTLFLYFGIKVIK